MFIKNIYKNYGQSIKILEYRRGIFIEQPRCKLHDQAACSECFGRGRSLSPSKSSLIRTKTAITDYVLCNEFDLFATFTFDPKKVNSFDIELARKSMAKWLNNQKINSPDLAYLIVPEKHKSGRIHFHALLKNYNKKLKYTGKQKNNRKIFNIPAWKFGFSTAIPIDNNEAVGYYMQKYITKDMVKDFNKKRYWVSRNLKKPKRLYNVDMKGVHVMNPGTVIAFENEAYTVYKSTN